MLAQSKHQIEEYCTFFEVGGKATDKVGVGSADLRQPAEAL
jgi:hypothetical protein